MHDFCRGKTKRSLIIFPDHRPLFQGSPHCLWECLVRRRSNRLFSPALCHSPPFTLKCFSRHRSVRPRCQRSRRRWSRNSPDCQAGRYPGKMLCASTCFPFGSSQTICWTPAAANSYSCGAGRSCLSDSAARLLRRFACCGSNTLWSTPVNPLGLLRLRWTNFWFSHQGGCAPCTGSRMPR